MITLDNGNTFSYVSMGEFNSEQKWVHPERRIKEYELIFAVKNTIYIEEDGIAYELKPNQMLILEAGRLHKGYKESIPPTVFYWMHFKTDLPLPFKLYGGEEYYEVKQLLKKLLHISNTASYSVYAADATAFMIYEELVRCGKSIVAAGTNTVNKIAEYLRISIRHNPTVFATAQRFGYSPDYIGKLFKQHFGMGIKDYMTALRLNAAKDLLLTTDFSLKQIASELGYDNEKLFIKFFIYHEKISPTVYRSKFYNTHMNNK